MYQNTVRITVQCVCTDSTVWYVSACSVCVQTVQYGMCQHGVCVCVCTDSRVWCQHAVCVYRQYGTVCVSMQCACTESTVW